MGLIALTLWAAQAEPIIVRKISLPAHDPGWSYPRLSSGVFIHWRGDTFASDRDENLDAHDRDGKVMFRSRLWFPDAVRLQILDVAASTKGELAVLATAYSSSGAVSHFWARVPMDGRAATVHQMSPFGGIRITLGSDDAVWILGLEVGPAGRMMAAGPHAALRQFTLEGKLVASFFNWPAIECGRHPADLSAGFPFVAAGMGRMGVFLAACNQWIEFARGDIVEKRTVTNPTLSGKTKPEMLLSVALTGGNEVFANYGNGTTLQLDRSLDRWVPVPDLTCGRILGVEDLSLVCSRGTEIVWYRLGTPGGR